MDFVVAAETLAEAGRWAGPGAWWPIFPLLWLLLFGGIAFALFRGRRQWGAPHMRPTAEGVLAERYARGEISDEEYRERLSVLTQTRR
jgi:putative membrane protein